MDQFDVYTNPSKQTRKIYPYILDIQHTLLEELTTRIVVPLGVVSEFDRQELKGLTPKVEFEGVELLVLMPQVTSIPARILKKPVGTLSHLRGEIISALDLAVTGI